MTQQDAFKATAIRRDLYLDNDATAFVITSQCMGGKGLESISEQWRQAIVAGDLLPVSLWHDDPFVVRVVLGDSLKPQENLEWVGKFSWPLRVPDGRLAIVSGVEFLEETFEELDEWQADYVCFLDVPPGDYLVTIYAYLNSVNGEAFLKEATPNDAKEPIGAFFRRTHPGKEFPIWLQKHCVTYPATDPNHVDYWQQAKPLSRETTQYISFLLHLTSQQIDSDATKREGIPDLDDGFFWLAFERRKPAYCPQGIEATVELDSSV